MGGVERVKTACSRPPPRATLPGFNNVAQDGLGLLLCERMPLSCALITPSFRLDFERCALLTESVERFVPPHVTHYLIVDRRDVPQFRALEGKRTRLLVVEDIVPYWIVRIPKIRRF